MYCVRKVTNDLYWVGANDHRLAPVSYTHLDVYKRQHIKGYKGGLQLWE